VPFVLALVLLATSVVAIRDGTWRWNALLFATAFVQGSLPGIAKAGVPIAGAFHPVLALAMFWMGLLILRDAQVRMRAPQEAPASVASESAASAH
jgi:hypothetical protein